MLKWCQIRVFLITCAGVLTGSILAHAFHVVPALIVVPIGVAGWLGGNALNAVIARRSSAACGPVSFQNLGQPDSNNPAAPSLGEIPLENLS